MKTNSALETTGQDWANHLSHEVSGNGTMCLAALLSGKPDAAVLRQATADLIALQPVLGCRFDETQDPPVWVSADGTGWFTQAEARDLREELEAFAEKAPAHGGQIEVRLISTAGLEMLCLRLNHAATDGGGARGCLALLSRCYNLRYAGGKVTEHIPLDRSDGQVFARCGLPDFRMALRRETPTPSSIATVPYAGMDGCKAQYRWTSLPLSAVKCPGGTVNDRLLAAYALALSSTCIAEGPVVIHMTVDLRRYLDEASAPIASNLSGMEAVSVAFSPQASFANVLAEVHRQTVLLKSNHAGLSSAAMMSYLRTMPYGKARGVLVDAGRKSRLSGTAAPILSNLGQIFSDTMRFGDSVVTDILPLLPALHAPAFMLGAGGYGDMLTLSAGFFAEERAADGVEQLLLSIRDILQNEPM
jgi:NRPS condensation-like uncharacterized protein